MNITNLQYQIYDTEKHVRYMAEAVMSGLKCMSVGMSCTDDNVG